MELLNQDVRYGLRQVVRHRAFAAIVVLTLALGIGVNALIFSIADLVVFRPLPFKDMDTVAAMWMTHPDRGDARVDVSYADYLEWERQATSLSALSARRYRNYNLTRVDEPTRIFAAEAAANLFEVWGLEAVHGRLFRPEEDRPGADRVVVLSHGFWERQFGKSPDVLGEVVWLDAEPYTIVGVVTPKVEIGSLGTVNLWAPLRPDADPEDRETRELRVAGRLAEGVTLEQAAAELAAIAVRQRRDHPATNAGWDVRVVPMRDALMGRRSYLIVTLLSLTVVFVLAIACTNVANMMLSRTAARSRETAVRTALGAGRLRLVRQLVTEGALLAVMGGALGVVLAWWGIEIIHRTTYEPAFQFVTISRRVLLFTLGISLLTPLFFGLLPALQAARADVASALKEGAGRSVVAGGRRGRGALVVVQLSLALMLLVVAGLSIRTAVQVQNLDMGFDRDRLVTLRIDLPAARYATDDQLRGFVDQLVERLEAQPSGEGVAVATGIPVIDGTATRALSIQGADAPTSDASPWAAETVVGAGYFQALRIPLKQGRAFTAEDAPASQPVAIVSQAFAHRYLGEGPVLGRRIKLGAPGSDEPWLEIVGLSADLVNPNLTEPPLPQVYLPFTQRPARSLAVMVRSADTAGVIAAARAEIARLDPDQVLWNARSMAEALREELNASRVFTTLFSVFGLAALALAALGLYGVISYGVSQRRQEIGVRVALGARRSDVMRMIVGEGAALTGIGLVVGVFGGFGLGRAMTSLLVGVSPADPLTFVGVTLVLTAVALVASLVPARRAARLDPIQALRPD